MVTTYIKYPIPQGHTTDFPLGRGTFRDMTGDVLNHNSHKVLLWRSANPNLVFVQVDEEDVDIECGQASTDANLRDGICKGSSLLVRESRRVGVKFPERHFGDNTLGQVSRSGDDQIIMSAGKETYITRLLLHVVMPL